ncbi:MAG: hypothetical protein ACI835_001370 [Planctomycetota bacterium]|jgi:hypothetical protein
MSGPGVRSVRSLVERALPSLRVDPTFTDPRYRLEENRRMVGVQLHQLEAAVGV